MSAMKPLCVALPLANVIDPAVELEHRRPAPIQPQVIQRPDPVALVVHHLGLGGARDGDRGQIAERDHQLAATLLFQVHRLPGRHLRHAVESHAFA
jgi:hypothetical protein